MSRTVLTVACNRKRAPHVLGSVVADDTGALTVRFFAALRTVKNGAPALERVATERPLDELMGDAWPLYCSGCSRRFFTSGLNLLQALQQGQRWLALEHEGFLADPLGVLRRRHGRG